MASYSIRDLEKMTGIKAHTIRIWERRYNLIEPQRTTTNIRFYTDNDLKRILNVSILGQNGYKISKIALFDDKELNAKVADLCIEKSSDNLYTESLVVAMLDIDDKKFSETLNSAIKNKGFELTVETILFPFLARVGTLWQTGSIIPAQEHFISNLIRQKLIVAIDHEMTKQKQTRHRMVFFLPEGEFHELGLLFFSLIARKENLEVIYLGASVPIADLHHLGQLKPTDLFFTSFTTSIGNDSFDEKIDQLKSAFPKQQFFISGLQTKELKVALPENFTIIATTNEFRSEMQKLL